MFYLIGTGISGWDDIPLKGLELCKNSDEIYLERYTSIISDSNVRKLSEIIGKPILELSRDELESHFEGVILEKAKNANVALLIIGDPLTATTHIEFLKACKDASVKYEVVHASSIHSSVCETGLHVYKFGRSCSIPYPEINYTPTSYFDIIEYNHKNDSHTIVFLDIRKKEEKYMSVNEGLKILLNVSKERNGFFNESTEVIGIARLGFKDQIIKYGTVKELISFDFGPNPHIIIIPSLGAIEKDYVQALY